MTRIDHRDRSPVAVGASVVIALAMLVAGCDTSPQTGPEAPPTVSQAKPSTASIVLSARGMGLDVPAPPPGFRLTWKDDFNGPAGKHLSPGKWIYDIGTSYGCVGCPDHWGTFEIETMTDSPDNVSLDGEGNLLITPIRDPDGHWTSGRIETRKVDFTAGDHGILRVEAAIHLPQTGFGPEAPDTGRPSGCSGRRSAVPS